MKRPLLSRATAVCAGFAAGALAGIGLPWIEAVGGPCCISIINNDASTQGAAYGVVVAVTGISDDISVLNRRLVSNEERC